ncbi:MAG: crotonase/enoyl-CoA hydratase family protein [Myxococcales bacterium]|nr:crotonase/enoyl-CoA hydratase family protein [Myxococcales bacterium]
MSVETLRTLTYETTGRIARITLNRPERGNSITFEMPQEIAASVERANLDPEIHVIALSGNGKGFCGGYDLGHAEDDPGQVGYSDPASSPLPPGSALDPEVVLGNHDPRRTWDPMLDYAMMSRNLKGFMSLFHGDKPVIAKIHGFCVGGGSDMALCADLLVVADDAKIGYPPARVWGCPTSAMWVYRIGMERTKRLLFTGDCLSGKEAAAWGLAVESAPPAELDAKFEALLQRIAQVPQNQLMMMKLMVNQSIVQQGLYTSQVLGTVFDGITRHTPEGYAFAARAREVGFRQAVRERDQPFGDAGPSTFKG